MYANILRIEGTSAHSLAVKQLSRKGCALALGLNSFPLCIHTLCKYASDMSARPLGTFIVVREFIPFY